MWCHRALPRHVLPTLLTRASVGRARPTPKWGESGKNREAQDGRWQLRSLQRGQEGASPGCACSLPGEASPPGGLSLSGRQAGSWPRRSAGRAPPLMFRSLPPLYPPACQPPVSPTAGLPPPSPAQASPGAHRLLALALGPHAHPRHTRVLGLSDPTQTLPGLVSGFLALGVLGSQGVTGPGPSSQLPPSAWQ